MPDREVETIRDLIYYQYAKQIARSAFGAPDGKAAKRQHYGFIKKTFRDLKSGRKSWSEITREDKQLVMGGDACGYCGGDGVLDWEHVVPKSVRITPRCATCEVIGQVHNLIRACSRCNREKGRLGLYEFYRRQRPDEPKFFDVIPPLAEKKYLKTIWHCHTCAGTLDGGDIDGDGELTVLDIDHVLDRRVL